MFSFDRFQVTPAALSDVVDTGLEMLGAPILSPIEPPADDVPTFRIPELGESWTETLDALRPARGRDEPFWEWRRRPPRPVHFEPLDKMDDSRAQLHLSHPFVQRILQRFLSQGYSAHELSRVTAVLHPRDAAPRVLAFGRLSLFGVGAVRLHDELVAMASEWTPDGPAEPFADDGDHDALRRLDRLLRGKPGGRDVPAGVRERLLASSPADFAALWPHLEADAERRAREAEGKLEARGTTDADALRKILASQKRAIEDTLEAHRQYPLEFTERERAQWVQFREDEKFMQERLERIDRELDEEPGRLRELYRVVMRRFVPVGMVYLWPASRV